MTGNASKLPLALSLSLQARAAQSGAHHGRLTRFLQQQQQHGACCQRKPVQLLHHGTQANKDDAHSVVVLSALQKREFFTRLVSLIFKAPTPETCKDEGSDMAPQKGVVSRYLSAA